MAGSFGYEAAHYDVSMRMAELSLLPAVRKADADDADRRRRHELPPPDRRRHAGKRRSDASRARGPRARARARSLRRHARRCIMRTTPIASHADASRPRCLLAGDFAMARAVRWRRSPFEVFHADSLAGPMRELKTAFEAQHASVTITLTSGVSRDLAARILKGERCDVFAPSSPAVIDQDLMGKKVAGTDRDAATWYVVFSANEMVVITAKGNPLGIRQDRRPRRPAGEVRARHRREGSRHQPHDRVRQARGGAGREARARAEDHRQRAGRSGEADDRSRRRRRGQAKAARTPASSTTRRPSPRATTSTSSAFPTAST